MGSRKPKKKTLKQRQENQLKDPFITLAALLEKTKKYSQELDSRYERLDNLNVGSTMRMKRRNDN